MKEQNSSERLVLSNNVKEVKPRPVLTLLSMKKCPTQSTDAATGSL